MITRFSEEKEKISNKLNALLAQIEKIKHETGIDLKELKEKVERAIVNIEKEKFSIALFGAFSDGKSTILSALIKSLDIKISVEPTTDQIKEYRYKDFFIVDTPGLFSEVLLHEERTKKYISEANVIIYTVDAVNPLKESHYKTLRWLLKDLNKIDSTIFVINKMDEVADLEDEEDFKENCEIKKEVVRDVLKQVVGVENFKRIVCVSADPYGLGLKEWFQKEEEYKKLSRLPLLEELLNEFIEKKKEDLIIKSGLSVINDMVMKINQQLLFLKKNLKTRLEVVKNQIEEIENRLETMKESIHRSYINIKEDLLALREDIIQEIQTAVDMRNLQEIWLKRLGKDGYILEEKINLIVEKHTEPLFQNVEVIIKGLEKSLTFHEEFLIPEEEVSLIKNIIKSIGVPSAEVIRNDILKFRDLLKLPIKFKPWGALKLAKFIKKLPIITEILDFVGKLIGAHIFQKKKEKTIKAVEEIFENIFKELSKENYLNYYFPNIGKMEEALKKLKIAEEQINTAIGKIDQILKLLSNIGEDDTPRAISESYEKLINM